MLRGGNGNDMSCVGGRGDRQALSADLGRDLLIGGTGKDTIYGSGNDDILIGGTTSYDNNVVALDAIMKEWGRNDTLRQPGQPPQEPLHRTV